MTFQLVEQLCVLTMWPNRLHLHLADIRSLSPAEVCGIQLNVQSNTIQYNNLAINTVFEAVVCSCGVLEFIILTISIGAATASMQMLHHGVGKRELRLRGKP